MPATRVTINVDKLRALDASGVGNGPFIPGADNEPETATFGATLYGITPVATPTDFLLLKGAANKVVRVKEIIISGSATAASNILVNLIRRSADNTGGTRNGVSAAAHDTNDGAAAASLFQYTANASGLGTQVAVIHSARLNLAPAANGSIDRITWQWSWKNEKAVVLRGASDFIAINLGGAAWPAGGALDVDLTWTEE